MISFSEDCRTVRKLGACCEEMPLSSKHTTGPKSRHGGTPTRRFCTARISRMQQSCDSSMRAAMPALRTLDQWCAVFPKETSRSRMAKVTRIASKAFFDTSSAQLLARTKHGGCSTNSVTDDTWQKLRILGAFGGRSYRTIARSRVALKKKLMKQRRKGKQFYVQYSRSLLKTQTINGPCSVATTIRIFFDARSLGKGKSHLTASSGTSDLESRVIDVSRTSSANLLMIEAAAGEGLHNRGRA
jgi:hypothetical protein